MGHFKGQVVLNRTATVNATTYYSEKSDVARVGAISYHLIWGILTGTWTVQVSNIEAPNEETDTDWVDVVLGTPINQPAGSASKDFVNLTSLKAGWVRLKLAVATGVGAASAHAAGGEA